MRNRGGRRRFSAGRRAFLVLLAAFCGALFAGRGVGAGRRLTAGDEREAMFYRRLDGKSG